MSLQGPQPGSSKLNSRGEEPGVSGCGSDTGPVTNAAVPQSSLSETDLTALVELFKDGKQSIPAIQEATFECIRKNIALLFSRDDLSAIAIPYEALMSTTRELTHFLTTSEPIIVPQNLRLLMNDMISCVDRADQLFRDENKQLEKDVSKLKALVAIQSDTLLTLWSCAGSCQDLLNDQVKSSAIAMIGNHTFSRGLTIESIEKLPKARLSLLQGYCYFADLLAASELMPLVRHIAELFLDNTDRLRRHTNSEKKVLFYNCLESSLSALVSCQFSGNCVDLWNKLLSSYAVGTPEWSSALIGLAKESIPDTAVSLSKLLTTIAQTRKQDRLDSLFGIVERYLLQHGAEAQLDQVTDVKSLVHMQADKILAFADKVQGRLDLYHRIEYREDQRQSHLDTDVGAEVFEIEDELDEIEPPPQKVRSILARFVGHFDD